MPYPSHFSPVELQFYATTATEITVIPTINDQTLYLMGRQIGPFKATQQITLPLWLAIFLKQQHKCRIDVPFFLRHEQLKDYVDRESISPDPIFLHVQSFFELAYTLLNKAPESFEKPRETRGLVQSLQTIRFEKLRKQIQKTTGPRKVKFFTSYEINKWRSGLSNLQKMVDKLAVKYENKN